jgi:ADP-ribosylglycohydrolase
MSNDRARGALLGLAVGDALGTTYEFDAIEQPDLPALATGPATDVVGKGPFDLVAGQVTDDTQLAICLARSLAEHRGLDIADVARRYVAWSDHAFDIGNQTRAAIDRLEAGEPASSAGLAVWRNSERRPAGNGSLMRTAPIAVAYATRSRDAVIDAAMADSLITHADPRCVLACAAFDAAIAAAINGSTLSTEGTSGERASASDGANTGAAMIDRASGSGFAMVGVARVALATAAQKLRAAWAGDATDLEHLERAVVDLESDLDAATHDSPKLYSPGLHIHRTAGFVRVAFRLAFWHAVHTRSWRDALVDVASRGGDSDTNAAIAGALLGARDGASTIPAAWIERVLAVTQPGPTDWAEAHHPRHLLALIARE